MTGTPKTLLKALDTRDGHRCAWHPPGECNTETLTPQHRANRGMGGRKSLNRLSNLVWLCSEMNGLIESHAGVAREALERGIKISSHAEPSAVRIRHAVHGLVVLDDDGGITRVEQGDDG